jgi:hypothetical protein
MPAKKPEYRLSNAFSVRIRSVLSIFAMRIPAFFLRRLQTEPAQFACAEFIQYNPAAPVIIVFF